MNKLFFIVLFIFLSFLIRGQTGITFNDTIKPFGSGAYGIENVLEDANNYYALGVYNSSLGQFPFIIKINQFGQILNKELFIDTSFSYAPYPYNSFVKTNNNLLFCSPKWNNTIGTLGAVICVDKNTLDTVWTKTYTHPDTVIAQTATDVFSVLTAIRPTPEGGYILTGNYNKDCITGNVRSFLMKIDSLGNVEWRRTYSDVTGLFDFEISGDGSIYFIHPYGYNVISLRKVDSLGIFDWQIQINSGMTGWSDASSIALTPNNCIIGARTFMYNSDISNPKMGFNIFKVNLNTKQILWDKTYKINSTIECFTLHQALGVETLPDGSIIVSGTANSSQAVILKLNSNGDSLWSKTYTFPGSYWECQLNDLLVCDDGGFMGVGFFEDHNAGSTAWLFKTDSNGVVGFESPKAKVESEKFKLYPNPAQDYITLEFLQGLEQNAELKFYDALGRMVLQKSLNKGEIAFKLDLKPFETGVYFFEVIGDDGVLGSGRFVRE